MNRKFIKNSNKVLREVFNSNNCLDILSNFIESFLEIQIKSFVINKAPKNAENREYGIIDMRITTKEKEEINVGIQIIDGDYIQNKMFLYYAKIHSNQIYYNDNRKIAKTITINILDMQFFSSNQYHKTIKIKSNILNDNILETMELHVIELPKFQRINTGKISNKEAWTMYLNGKDEKSLEEAKQSNKHIQKLDNMIEKYWKNEKI